MNLVTKRIACCYADSGGTERLGGSMEREFDLPWEPLRSSNT